MCTQFIRNCWEHCIKNDDEAILACMFHGRNEIRVTSDQNNRIYIPTL